MCVWGVVRVLVIYAIEVDISLKENVLTVTSFR